MATSIIVKGLDELIARMQQYPNKLKAGMKVAIDASMLALWQNVPPYPDPPEGSRYVRKVSGGLAGSLGSGLGGGQAGGTPSIYEVHEMGSGGYQGQFGTDLDYAGYVIGAPSDQPHQAWMHKGRWWIITDIAARAHDKILGYFNMLATSMKNFLEGS